MVSSRIASVLTILFQAVSSMPAIAVLIVVVGRTVTDTWGAAGPGFPDPGATGARRVHRDQDRPVHCEQAAALFDRVAVSTAGEN